MCAPDRDGMMNARIASTPVVPFSIETKEETDARRSHMDCRSRFDDNARRDGPVARRRAD
jgi:hypothetical protein